MKKALFTCALILGSVAASQAATITLIGGATNNGDFSDPDLSAGKQNFSLGNITNWTNWTEGGAATNDTGAYEKPAPWGNVAYIQPNGAIRNMTTHTILVGDKFDFGFTDVLGSRGDATMELIYEDGGTYTAFGSWIDGNGNVDGQVYTNSYTVLPGDAFVGKLVGVGLRTTGSWPEVDNITLDVTTVPEPTSTALLGLGGLALLIRRRR